MDNMKENLPFTYERGKCKFSGQTDSDREILRLEVNWYWIWRIIWTIGGLLSAGGVYSIYKLFFHS